MAIAGGTKIETLDTPRQMLALRHRLEVRGGSSDRVVISGRRDRGPRVEVYARAHRVHRARASRAVVRGRVASRRRGGKVRDGKRTPDGTRLLRETAGDRVGPALARRWDGSRGG